MRKLIQLLTLCTIMVLGSISNTAQAQRSVPGKSRTAASKPRTTATAKPQSAPSILGTWVTDVLQFLGADEENEMDFTKGNVYFTYAAGNVLHIRMQIEGKMEQEGMSMEMGVDVRSDGSYKKSGNDITIESDPATVKVELTKFNLKLSDEMKAGLSALGMTEASITKMVKDESTKNMQNISDFKEAMSEIEGTFTIKSLTATTMAVTDETGKTLTFTRVQNNQKK